MARRAAKKSRGKKAAGRAGSRAIRWLAFPVALVLVVGTAIALLSQRSTQEVTRPKPERRASPSAVRGVSAESSGHDTISDESRDQLLEILRAADDQEDGR